MYNIYIYIDIYRYIQIYIYMFDTLNTHIDLKNLKSSPNLPLSNNLVFYMIYEVFYLVMAKYSDIRNNGWKVPTDELKHQSLTELENIT